MPLCRHCGIKPARRTAHCSDACRQADNNRAFQSTKAQRTRGIERKVNLLMERGGACEECGYSRNLAALEFHHRDRATKIFELNIRDLANRRLAAVEAEAAKCIVLCSNCHAEHEHPSLRWIKLAEDATPPRVYDHETKQTYDANSPEGIEFLSRWT